MIESFCLSGFTAGKMKQTKIRNTAKTKSRVFEGVIELLLMFD